MNLLSRILEPVERLILPWRCVFCGEILDRQMREQTRLTPEGRYFFPEIALCGVCQDALAQGMFEGCRFCGAFFEESVFAQAPCFLCGKQRFPFDRVVPFGPYVGDLRDVVLEMKKPGREVLVRTMAALMFHYRGGMLKKLRPDVVLPVPMHWFYKSVRGINSPEILAEELSRALGVPMESRLVECGKMTLSQRSVAMEERRANVEGVFRVSRTFQTSGRSTFSGKRALLVDDVMTTGSTCAQLARLLKEALGFSFVSVAVLARAKGTFHKKR